MSAKMIKCYGDRLGDGMIQMSFTLPVPASDEAKEAARLLLEKMGFTEISIITMEPIDPHFSFFVAYASSTHEIDFSQVKVPKREHPLYDFDEANKLLSQYVGRKSVVLGACIGTDAHTVGIDAIFNMKGYMGDYGLERYPAFKACNLRAQVSTEELVRKVVEYQADAVLISRVVTQRDSHIVELTKFIQELKVAENVPPHLIKICGGPRIDHAKALELGYDAGFGPGTKPSQVASFLVGELIKRCGGSSKSSQYGNKQIDRSMKNAQPSDLAPSVDENKKSENNEAEGDGE